MLLLPKGQRLLVHARAAWLDRVRAQLAKIEKQEGGLQYWTGVARNDITEPSHGKLPAEMTSDELEHELERRKKYPY
jgi:hypothetical protein